MQAGDRLGAFEIVASIGAGGMGEVYKARDTRLDRTVAIKVMPAALAATPEMRGRFEREARAISALAHPHICTLFDVGNHNGIEYLVMELLEGETLAQRLTHGALPLDQVLSIGAQVADALGFAHRRGIVHRDLKPGNMMLTKTGAKLLDFGLAKLQAPITPTGVATQTAARSEPEPLTLEGVVVGTPQYMAPEQLRGQALDARSDIFALGAVLYEMSSGGRAFAGASQADAIAHILSTDPARDAGLETLQPPALDRIVRRCLARDPDDRWQNASDLAIELRWMAEGEMETSPRVIARRNAGVSILAWSIATIVLLVSALFIDRTYFQRAVPAAHPVRLSLVPPRGAPYVFFNEATLSHDGRQIAFVGYNVDGKRRLWVRAIDAQTARPLTGTDDAQFPFWSPDGRSLAFFAEGKLRRIDVESGTPLTLCDAPTPQGGTWSRAGVIVFSSGILQRVSATGGKPVELLQLEAPEEAHRWPSFLSDGRRFVFLGDASNAQDHHLKVGSIDSDRTQIVVQAISNGTVTSSGELLYVRGGALLAQPLDLERLVPVGDPSTLAEQICLNDGNHLFEFSASDTGMLTYRSLAPESQLTWFDRSGKRLAAVGDPGAIDGIDLSPDDSHVVFSNLDSDGRHADLWLLDLVRGHTSRFTSDHALNSHARWSRDGEHIAFTSIRNQQEQIFQRTVAAPHREELLFTSEATTEAMTWLPDGNLLVWDQGKMLSLSTTHKPEAMHVTLPDANSARISDDGHWIAYASTESGRAEVYVESFPISTGNHRISIGGGQSPHWRKDGKELFFLDYTSTTILSSMIETAPQFAASAPVELFRIAGAFDFAVASDGQRFLLNVGVEDPELSPLSVVLDWNAATAR